MRRLQRSLILLGSAVALAMPALWVSAQPAPATVPGQPGDPATQPVVPNPNSTPAPTPGNMEIRIPSTRAAATKFSFNFKDAPIDAVLNHISAQAGFTVIKYTTIEGRVTVVSQVPVSAEEAVSLLNTVLSVQGYTAVQEGKTLKIMLTSTAKTANIPVFFGADYTKITPNDNLVTWVIPVKTVDAAKLKQDLQPLVNSNATLSANAASNVLILTDTQANIKRIVQIVNSLDTRDPASSAIVTRQLKNADAASAVKLITDIFKTDDQQGSNSNLPPQVQFMRRMMGGGRGGGGGGGGGPFGGGAGGATGESSEGGQRQAKITASSDARTNTIVVTGPKETLDLIEREILDKIDADPVTQQTFFIYPLKNAQAANLQTVLNNLFGGGNGGGAARTTSNTTSNRLSSGNTFSSSFGSGGGGGGRSGGGGGFGGSGGGGFGGSGSTGFGGSSSRSGGSGTTGGGFNRGNTGFSGGSGTGGGQNSAAAELQGQVYVVADTDTNSLLVTTASKFQDQVRAVIAELDRPIAQVLIKVLIAEVTHENTDDLSFDFSVLNQRAGTSLVNGVATPVNKGTTGGTSFADTRTTPGGLVVSLVESNVQATLTALQVNNKLDVLSRPYILATDNQPAEIVVGNEVPFITDSNVTSLGTIVNTVQYRQIGIILDVTPHINPDGLVIMDVAPEISSQTSQFVQVTAGVNAQVYAIRSAYSRVGVKDGNTIVIGGLMEDRKTAVLQKVPILGDIPVLGTLFQSNHVDKSKTELLIFLTPHVAQQPDFLKSMSKDELKGLKLTPGAVQPGVFDEQIRGLQRGGAETGSGNLIPKTPPTPATPPAKGE